MAFFFCLLVLWCSVVSDGLRYSRQIKPARVSFFFCRLIFRLNFWTGDGVGAREQVDAGGVSTTQPSPTVLEVVRRMLKQVRAQIR